MNRLDLIRQLIKYNYRLSQPAGRDLNLLVEIMEQLHLVPKSLSSLEYSIFIKNVKVARVNFFWNHPEEIEITMKNNKVITMPHRSSWLDICKLIIADNLIQNE